MCVHDVYVCFKSLLEQDRTCTHTHTHRYIHTMNNQYFMCLHFQTEIFIQQIAYSDMWYTKYHPEPGDDRVKYK